MSVKASLGVSIVTSLGRSVSTRASVRLSLEPPGGAYVDLNCIMCSISKFLVCGSY